jgi:transposase-like protein
MKKVQASQRTRQTISDLLTKGTGREDPLSELIRLAVQGMIEEALEGAVRDLLGRDYYRHGTGTTGYRNGYRRGRVKTSEGEVNYSAPQVRDVDAGSLKELRKLLGGRSEALERLAVEMYARGCSTRDIEAIFRDDEGQSLLSKSAVSELTEVLWAEYEEFATRDLSQIRPLYLFLDGIAERLRPGAKRETVLCAWAISWDGSKVLIHLAPGTKESTECCRDFLQDLQRRGLADPVLVVTDGAAGLIRAVEECFSASLRQRCLAHRMRNLMSKFSAAEIATEFKQAAKAAYEAPSVAMARVLREDLVERYGKQYPTAVRCFEEDFEACIAHLNCPATHRRAIRTTNLLERLFGEERRRLRAAGSLFGERPVLKLMYSAVIRASDSWRGVKVTEFETGQLKRLLQQLAKVHQKENLLAVQKGSTTNCVYGPPP